MLRFAAAAEIIETDFWVQYNELGGIQDGEEPSRSGETAYTAWQGCWTPIWRSTFTTIRMMNLPTRTFLMRTWPPKERRR